MTYEETVEKLDKFKELNLKFRWRWPYERPEIKLYVEPDGKLLFSSEVEFLIKGEEEEEGYWDGFKRKTRLICISGTFIKIYYKDKFANKTSKENMSILEFKHKMEECGLTPKFIDAKCGLKELLQG